MCGARPTASVNLDGPSCRRSRGSSAVRVPHKKLKLKPAMKMACLQWAASKPPQSQRTGRTGKRHTATGPRRHKTDRKHLFAQDGGRGGQERGGTARPRSSSPRHTKVKELFSDRTAGHRRSTSWLGSRPARSRQDRHFRHRELNNGKGSPWCRKDQSGHVELAKLLQERNPEAQRAWN